MYTVGYKCTVFLILMCKNLDIPDLSFFYDKFINDILSNKSQMGLTIKEIALP